MPFSREEKVPFSDSGALLSVVPELFVKSLRTQVWQDPSGASVCAEEQKADWLTAQERLPCGVHHGHCFGLLPYGSICVK